MTCWLQKVQRLIKIVVAVVLVNRSQLSIKWVTAGRFFMTLLLACMKEWTKIAGQWIPLSNFCTDWSWVLKASVEEKLVSDPQHKDCHKGNRGEPGQLALQEVVHSNLDKIISPLPEVWLWPRTEGRGLLREKQCALAFSPSTGKSSGPIARNQLMLPETD